MITKFNTLASMLELNTFSAQELADRISAPVESVRTIIGRLSEDWLATSKRPTGARGGQVKVHVLTPTGIAGIRKELGKLPDLPSVVPNRPSGSAPDKAPLGLLRARLLEKELETAIEERREVIREQIVDLLEGTARVLGEPSAPENAATLLAETEAMWRRVVQTPGNQVIEADLGLASADSISRIVSDGQPVARTQGMSTETEQIQSTWLKLVHAVSDETVVRTARNQSETVEAFSQRLTPALMDVIKRYSDVWPLEKSWAMTYEIEKALNPMVVEVLRSLRKSDEAARLVHSPIEKFDKMAEFKRWLTHASRRVDGLTSGSHESVLVSPVFADDESDRDLAVYAKGALDVVIARVNGINAAESRPTYWVESLSGIDDLIQKQTMGAVSTGLPALFACFDSENHRGDLEPKLIQTVQLRMGRGPTIFLDRSENGHIADLSKKNNISYQPDAKNRFGEIISNSVEPYSFLYA